MVKEEINNRYPTLNVVGTGSFSGRDLTAGSIEAIKKSKFLFIPQYKGKNYALDSVKENLNEEEIPEIVILPVGMGMMTDEAYENVARVIEDKLKEDSVGTYITIGDPSICSTFYNFSKFLSKDVNINVYPGVSTAFSAAALVKIPLMEKGQVLTIMDEFPNESQLQYSHSIAVIKNRNRKEEKEELLKNIKKYGFKWWFIKRISSPEEEVITDEEKFLNDGDYMAMILMRKEDN